MHISATLKMGLLSGLFILASSSGFAATPTSYQTTEYNFSYALAAIKASDAYARGFTGAGQIVAVFDSGVTAANADLQGRLTGPGWDAIAGHMGAWGDSNGHGTFVSGIIAAGKNSYGMHGVAYDARIMPIRIINPDGSITLSDAKMATAIRYALSHGARIFNNSWNSSSTIYRVTKAQLNTWMPQELAAYRIAANNNAIIVFAAGNDSKFNPGFYAALPVLYPELQRGWIAAVATEEDGSLAYYSNKCGSAANWCIAAPGSRLSSTLGAGYGIGSGTSFSAPVVAGAVAILKQRWPGLANHQIKSILFSTANKGGIYANRAIYGQGMLDLEKATRPTGVTSVPARSGASVSTTASSGVFSRSVQSFGEGLPHMIILDGYGRDFFVDTASLFQQQDESFDSVTALADFGDGMDIIQDENMSYGFAPAPQNRIGLPGAPFEGARMFIDSGDNALGFTAAVNMSPSMVFGLSPNVNASGLLVDSEAASNAYFNLAKNPSSFAATHRFNENIWVKAGAFFGEQLFDPSAPATLGSDPNYLASRGQVMGGVMQLGKNIGRKSAVALQAGFIVEEGAMLGSISSGAAALAESSTTHFIGAEAKFDLSAGFKAFAGFEIGQTDVSAAKNSLVEGVSDLVSDSWRMGIGKTGVIGKKDRLGFMVSQPLHAESGSANLSLPTALNADGSIAYTSSQAGLAAGAREIDIQAFYAAEISKDSSIATGILFRQNPGNASGDSEAVALARYKLSF